MNNLIVPAGLTDVKPIREIIYEHLRQAILDRMIKPGERLVERDIAAKFNASRTPVREALRKLETEGFVEYLARRGVIVRGFDSSEIEEIYKIRKALECMAIRSAISKISVTQIDAMKGVLNWLEQAGDGDAARNAVEKLHEFDDVILVAADMPILKGFLQSLREMLQRCRTINLSKAPRRKEAIKEHKDILQAIIDRDAARAEELVC